MRIIDTFATHITERIPPVVKVADRRPELLLHEISNLVVTPQWEQHLRVILDRWVNTATRAGDTDPGIWISGFFGSGKSLLLKVLGALLEGGHLAGQAVDDVFLQRLPPESPDRGEIKRLLASARRTITTTSVGGNIQAVLVSSTDSLAMITFKLFAAQHGYTHNWAFGWAVEYYIDQAGKQAAFQARAAELAGQPWEELVEDAEFNIDSIMQAAADTLPEHFREGRAAVERTLAAATQSGITPNDVVDRFVRWCETRDTASTRHRLLLQLDELGQWIASGNGNDRAQQVQALVETAGVRGKGRVWIAITAHGDVQAMRASVQQELYAKINQRFSVQCKLSNDDMSQVVEERVLRKTQGGRAELAGRFAARSGELTDLGTLQRARRVYPAPTNETFPLLYPYLPWTVKVIPDIVKGIAQAAGRDEALTGANRTMIAVVQGAILDTPELPQAAVGRLLNLVDLYPQLVADVPVETKTDLNRVAQSVPNATARTSEVAIALYLLGKAEYIPCTPENLARALVNGLDAHPAALAAQVVPELARLVDAGYAKQVGEEYIFLTTQQRTFQDKVRERQRELLAQNFELSQALREYDSDDFFRLNQIQILGRTLNLKLLIDNRTAQSGQSRVTVQILSPLQRALDPDIGNDATMRLRSNQQPDTFFVRLQEAPQLRQSLALALATNEIADRVITANPTGMEADVARQAKLSDLSSHKTAVRRYLGDAVRGAVIYFRGSDYHVTGGDSPGDAARRLLAQLLPTIYARLHEVQHRVVNEEGAVRSALNGSTSNTELQLLNTLKNDGTIDESSPLLSAVRGVLPLENTDRPAIEAIELRRIFEDPPYGWDGNAIKVALALLLRAGSCRFVVDGRPISDPVDPEAQLALVRDARFRTLRVWGVPTVIDPGELMAARGLIETLFGVRTSLVAATLNNTLGQELDKLAARCRAAQSWAATVGLPLPAAFGAGQSVVEQLLANPMPNARIPQFGPHYADLNALIELLERLEAFQTRSGQAFVRLRDYFNQMINANLNLPALQTFLADWNTLQTERQFVDTRRWEELVRSQQHADEAVRAQIDRWTLQARQTIDDSIARIPEQLREAGAPETEIDQHAATLQAPFTAFSDRISATPTLQEARNFAPQLQMLELDLQGAIERLRERWQPVLPPAPGRVNVRDYIPDTLISSPAELDALLAQVRGAVLAALEWEEARV